MILPELPEALTTGEEKELEEQRLRVENMHR